MGGVMKMSDVKGKRKPSVPTYDDNGKPRAITMGDIRLDQHIAQLYQKKETRKLHDKFPSGIWSGRRCFIIGGGPSLRGFDFSQLKGELVITCNRGLESFPDSAFNLCQDARMWGWWECGDLGVEAKKKFDNYSGTKAWMNVQSFPYPEDISIVPICHESDFNYKNYFGGIPPHGNTGLNALCIASCLGANPIYLLGFDCKGENGRTANHYQNCPDKDQSYPDSSEERVYKSFVQEFNEVSHLIKARTNVINLNRNSAIRCFEFGDFKDLPKIKRPLYISYYTKGTGYEVEIERLHESLHKFGLEHELIGIDDRGSWRTNIHARIQVLRDALDKFGRDIVYIDADGAVIHYPDVFDTVDADFAAVWLDREKYFPGIWKEAFYGEAPGGKWEILGGTMFFKNSAPAREMLDVWERLDAPMDTHLSQVHLQKAIEAAVGIKTKVLPDGYCQIFDIMASAGEPVIEHYQASRRSIGAVKINNGVKTLDPVVLEGKK